MRNALGWAFVCGDGGCDYGKRLIRAREAAAEFVEQCARLRVDVEAALDVQMNKEAPEDDFWFGFNFTAN